MKKIVHISTSDRAGGAAIAAWRLHQGLREMGVNSKVVSRHRTYENSDISCISTPLFEAADLFHQRRMVPAQAPDATLFSLSPVSVPLLDHPWIQAADVVHLHWIAQFVAPEDVAELAKAGKTVFWTFHDQWPYTGGCHYVGGSTRQESDWDGTSQINESLHRLARIEFQRKRRAYADGPIQVIAPSRWIALEAVASGLFRAEQIHVVPNGINTRVFHPIDVPTVEEETAGVSLLFGCQYLAERRKGYHELQEALTLCLSHTRFAKAVQDGSIRMTTFGAAPHNGFDLPIPAVHLGALTGESQVAEVLRASSAFVCPTLEDNLPNVVMESIACGCPVLAFDTGGIPDMVTHGLNGLLAAKGDIHALSACLTDFCLDHLLRKRLRDGTKPAHPANHSVEKQASRMMELYEAAAPVFRTTTNTIIPDSLPKLAVNAAILPHFGSEFTQMFLEERNFRELNFSAQVDQYQEKLGHSSERITEFQQLTDELQRRLSRMTSVATRRQFVVKKLKSKLKQSTLRRNRLQIRITKLQQQIRNPKKFSGIKSLLKLTRSYLLKKFKGC